MTAIPKRRLARRVAGLIAVTAAAIFGPFAVLAEPAGATPCAYVKAWVNHIGIPIGEPCSGQTICDGDVLLVAGTGAEYSYCVI